MDPKLTDAALDYVLENHARVSTVHPCLVNVARALTDKSFNRVTLDLSYERAMEGQFGNGHIKSVIPPTCSQDWRADSRVCRASTVDYGLFPLMNLNMQGAQILHFQYVPYAAEETAWRIYCALASRLSDTRPIERHPNDGARRAEAFMLARWNLIKKVEERIGSALEDLDVCTHSNGLLLVGRFGTYRESATREIKSLFSNERVFSENASYFQIERTWRSVGTDGDIGELLSAMAGLFSVYEYATDDDDISATQAEESFRIYRWARK